MPRIVLRGDPLARAFWFLKEILMNILKLTVLAVFFLMQPLGVRAATKTMKTSATKQPTIMATVDNSQKSVVPTTQKSSKKNKTTVLKKGSRKAKIPTQATLKKPEGLIIGKNLKVKMSLSEAIILLGIPGSVKINRGIESKLDSFSIEYANHGIVLHGLNNKKHIEALEILPQFKGSFVEGVKLGEKFAVLIEKLGVPQTMNSSLAKYPKQGMYFSLKENVLVAAHVFAKNSQILSHQLYKSK